MSQHYSWIEKDDKTIFLTADDVFKSRRGKQLRQHTCRWDWHGHGAIRWFYGFTGGRDRECTEFSTPKNFPPELVTAIVAGRMWGLGITDNMRAMLLAPAWKQYDAVRAEAWKKYHAKYDAVVIPAWKKYRSVPLASKNYDAVEAEAFAKFRTVGAEARNKYEAVVTEAFAQLWAEPTNRTAVWRTALEVE
jgi:hypothetical protein